MPGFRSHYFLGKTTYDMLKKDDKLPASVLQHPRVFSLGEQGPDMFFYSPQAHLFYKKNIGMAMHSSNVNKTFEGLLLARAAMNDEAEQDIADAYIMGFIGHYTLDTICHPYISWRQEKFKYAGRFTESFGVHVLLETDIDNDNVRKFLGIEPIQFNHYDTIKVSKKERDVVAKLLTEAINYAFPNQGQKVRHVKSAITMSRNLFKWMVDKRGIKKKAVMLFDRIFFKHIFLSSIISNDWLHAYEDPCNELHKEWWNPWDESIRSTKDFYQLMDDAREVYVRRLNLYQDWRDNMGNEKMEKLLEDLGDNSYDSGLPWEETARISKAAGL